MARQRWSFCLCCWASHVCFWTHINPFTFSVVAPSSVEPRVSTRALFSPSLKQKNVPEEGCEWQINLKSRFGAGALERHAGVDVFAFPASTDTSKEEPDL